MCCSIPVLCDTGGYKESTANSILKAAHEIYCRNYVGPHGIGRKFWKFLQTAEKNPAHPLWEQLVVDVEPQEWEGFMCAPDWDTYKIPAVTRKQARNPVLGSRTRFDQQTVETLDVMEQGSPATYSPTPSDSTVNRVSVQAKTFNLTVQPLLSAAKTSSGSGNPSADYQDDLDEFTYTHNLNHMTLWLRMQQLTGCQCMPKLSASEGSLCSQHRHSPALGLPLQTTKMTLTHLHTHTKYTQLLPQMTLNLTLPLICLQPGRLKIRQQWMRSALNWTENL